MNTLKKSWMNFKNSFLLYQTITKNVLGYFQVNSEILETRISSSSKFVPQKNSSSIFKFEPEKVQEVQVFSYQVISSLLPSLFITTQLNSQFLTPSLSKKALIVPHYCFANLNHRGGEQAKQYWLSSFPTVPAMG